MAHDGAVLVIDDRGEVAASVRTVVGDQRRVRVETALTSGLGALKDGPWNVTLLSLDLPGVGPELVGRLIEEGNAGVVVLTARSVDAELAMELTRLGAAELLGVPLQTDLLARVLLVEVERGSRVPLPTETTDRELVGSSAQLLEVLKQVGRVAGSGATVLVTGESGTGKELIARAIHRMSPRAKRPFVAVNCAAIPEDLLESELFGHERGAFTGAVGRKTGRFERAHGGTLFLDGIGDMSLVLQAKILRALQEREIERLGGEERIKVDVRVVAATHRDLQALVAGGEYREDLYYRLAVVRLHLPALRERVGDLRDLTLHYAARLAAEHRRPLRFVSETALRRLDAHGWPGNVRELRNVLERAVLESRGDTLAARDIKIDPPRGLVAVGEILPGYSPTLTLGELEALHIARVLEEVDGHLIRAAQVLGVHRNTVARKAREYGLLGR